MDAVLRFENFSVYPEIIHGFSTKNLGDMNPGNGEDVWQNIGRFLNLLGNKRENLILAEQIHQNQAVVVEEKERGQIVKGVDGMVTNVREVVLGVKIADCLPIMLYDSEKKVIGIAHAGWQGIIEGIIQATIEKMKSLGSQPDDVLVGIGPHIGGCCFTVSEERSQIFKEKFGNLPGMIYDDPDGIHLDLALPALFQLEQMGIKRENIEILLTCTSCQNQDFFSFRRERMDKRMLGVIGLR